MFQKEGLLGVLRNSLLTGATDIQSTDCNVSKNELLTKFLQVVLKISENFQKKSVMEFYFSKLQAYKQQPSALRSKFRKKKLK